jgi:hypothetical protein
MSEVQAPVAKSEETHLTAELLGKLTAAYGDSDRALADRAVAVHAAIAYGVDVKTMAADMAAAHRADDKVPAVSAATLGFAKFAGTVADLVGTDLRAWVKRDYRQVASVVRAGKRGGLGPVTKSIRDAVKVVDKSEVAAREEIALERIADVLATVKPAPAPRAVKSATEPGTEPAAGKRETVSDAMSAGAALATVRALTAWLTTGTGTWSPDLESALADLRSAATDARKRGAAATATRTGASTATPATVAAGK